MLCLFEHPSLKQLFYFTTSYILFGDANGAEITHFTFKIYCEVTVAIEILHLYCMSLNKSFTLGCATVRNKRS